MFQGCLLAQLIIESINQLGACEGVLMNDRNGENGMDGEVCGLEGCGMILHYKRYPESTLNTQPFDRLIIVMMMMTRGIFVSPIDGFPYPDVCLYLRYNWRKK